MGTKEFKAGDVVFLKSGGPKMTVSYIDEGCAHCIWFCCSLEAQSDVSKYEGVFALACLFHCEH